MRKCSHQPKMITWVFHLAIKKTKYKQMKDMKIVISESKQELGKKRSRKGCRINS